MSSNQNIILDQAKELIAKHGEKAINVAKRRVDNLQNQHSKESDSIFMLLSEVEKLVEGKPVKTKF